MTATARPGVSAPKLEAALLDEIERMRAAPITAEELARATRRIESSFAYQTESVTAQARELGYWAMVDDWRYLTTYLDRIRALTPEAVQAVARKYFLADTRTVGHFVPTLGGASPASPPQEAAARVEKPGPGRPRDPDPAAVEARPRSTGTSPASRWRTASPSSSRRTRRAPRSRSGPACPRGTSSTRRTSRASRP